MIKYIIKRVLMLIPIMLGVMVIVFALKVITPGDPVIDILGDQATEEQMDAKREELGLNDPIVIQFFNYVKGVVTRADFGDSYRIGEPVIRELLPRLKISMTICLGAVAVGARWGLPLGSYRP